MSWTVTVSLHVFCFVIFNQFYKLATKTMNSAGALTVCLEFIGSITAALCIPFMDFKLPQKPIIWVLYCLAIVFYAINDRLGTTARSGLEASTFGIISQMSTMFLTLAGFVFFKEDFIILKFVGALLILLGNIVVFCKKGQRFNKYLIFGILANLAFTAALFLDAYISSLFNLGLKVFLAMGIQACLIMLIERIKPSKLKEELKSGDLRILIITGMAWALGVVFQLKSFQLGNISVVTPLMSTTVIFNIIVGYFFLKEKGDMFKKILGAIFVLLGIICINI